MLDLVITILPRARGGHGGSLAARHTRVRNSVVPTIVPNCSASTRLSPLLIIGATGLATGAAGAPLLAICPPILTVLLATCASLLTPLHPLRLRLGT